MGYSIISKKLKMWNKIKWLLGLESKISLPIYTNLNQSNKTILVIDDDIPHYDKSSGSKRIFELLKIFKHLELNVIFLPNDGLAPEPYFSELRLLGVEVLTNSPKRKGMLKKLRATLPLVNYAWISRPMLNKEFQTIVRINREIKIIFDTVDLHFLRMQRQAKYEKDSILMQEALELEKLELLLATNADITLTVTEFEKNILELAQIKNVFVIPNIHEVKKNLHPISFENRKGILFIGGYKHAPNVDAVSWLINEIMPLVWEKLRGVTVYLLGSYPNKQVLSLSSDCVFVPGFIDDVSEYFFTSKIFVAPLRYGAGMKGKLGQSLEHGLPIVTTSIGAEGMNLTNNLNVLIADDTLDFANKIIELYQNVSTWSTIQSNAEQAICAYSPKVVSKQLKILFKGLDN
ncbi:MAG: glycosyltransferase [Sphingobacteriales bacterium]|nr:MAG: glycosyltransferase [Sphingobacteriales bacterium]TAF79955.1 MAG: glycosyltransferase [Sphingobacteriales bacterium]